LSESSTTTKINDEAGQHLIYLLRKSENHID
jgi:hypothetical protein